MATKRVCIIGCGPAGMAMLYQLGKLPDDQIPEIVCYEKQATWGGIWNVTWRTGTDEYGEQCHPSMYYDLWINDPKEIFEYPDYTYETHFGKLLPSYLPRSVARDYFPGRVTRGSTRDLKKYVKFSTVVKRVNYNAGSDDFTVVTKDLKENKEDVQRFTHVVVATGIFTLPNTPSFPGLEAFAGRILHVKDIKRVNEFKGQRMLIIGSSFSAEDLALQAYKYGVENIIITYRTNPLGYKWPNGIEERPLVIKFEEKAAHFKDGTTAEIGVVVFCTGYLIEFPFLSEELRLKTELSVFPDNLYKGVVWINGGNDKLMYIGIQYNLYFVNMFDAQASFACKNIMGTLELPSKREMLSDIRKWTEMKDAMDSHDAFQVLGSMAKYFKHIVITTGYRTDVLKAEELMAEMMNHRRENICTFRDKQFRSIYTNKLAPPPKIPWMEDYDETLEIISLPSTSTY